MSVLVLGLGNILLSDEGVGVHAIETFARRHAVPDGVDILDGGTCGMGLLDMITGRDTLIVVDAIRSDRRAPGTVVRLTGKAIDQFFRTRLSPHQLGLSEVLASLALTDAVPPLVIILGIVPESLALGLALTDRAQAGMETAVAMLADELLQLGYPCLPRSDSPVSQTAPSPLLAAE